MISIDALMAEKFPKFAERSKLFKITLLSFLRYIFHEREFKQFEAEYPHVEGFDFVESVLQFFHFGYKILDHHRERIPVNGKVIIVANHPIGSLDGLALLKLVGEIRPDAKVIANEILYQLKPLRSQLLPVDNMNGATRKENIAAIHKHLNEDGALIIFPAGEVSRFGPTGIKDGRWRTGFLRFAEKTNTPILPMFVDGRNSIFFYSLSLLAKPISTMWLVREMFKQAHNHVDIRVGRPIEVEQWRSLELDLNKTAKFFRKHCYQIAKKKPKAFGDEQQGIAHPENRKLLRDEVKSCERLGETVDGKQIYLYQYRPNSVIMREIGRLRELTFRAVKEGTGNRRDTDAYDRDYEQLVLWDDAELEIVGAYRVAPAANVLSKGQCSPKLYTQTLFKFAPEFEHYFAQGLELGRSFVQPKYWGKRSLDYLWYGIGAYLTARPQIRYLFGPVSISNTFPDDAKDLMVNFYREHYPAQNNWVVARSPFETTLQEVPDDFRSLKTAVSKLGVSVPTLYKQYAELCEPGGVQFFAFNVDHDFGDCVDALIVVDMHMLKANKRKRYLSSADDN